MKMISPSVQHLTVVGSNSLFFAAC